MEEWKQIEGYENIYEVSNCGRVRSCEGKTTQSILHGTRHWKSRILKPREDKKNKTLSVNLWKKNKGKSHSIHRLVATAFIPNPNNLYTVNHKDGNRYNNALDNLEWMSLKDNIRHGFENNLYTNQNKTVIENKVTNEIIEFRSTAMANRYMNKNHSYINNNIRRKKFENNEYRWEVL